MDEKHTEVVWLDGFHCSRPAIEACISELKARHMMVQAGIDRFSEADKIAYALLSRNELI